MGLGDDILALGRAKRLWEEHGERVVVGTRHRRYWSKVFDHAPCLIRPDEVIPDGAVFLDDVPGKRPYIDYSRSTPDRQVLRPEYRAEPGALFLSQEERILAGQWLGNQGLRPPILIAPHIKATFSGDNKRWPWKHWESIAWTCRQHDCPIVQVSPPGTPVVPGVDAALQHDDVRRALALLLYAECVVTTDGLFPHAAAALGLPAVVIWGARTDPKILGYPSHANLTHGSDWCGSMKTHCGHCAAAMHAITPGHVWWALYDVRLEAERCRG